MSALHRRSFLRCAVASAALLLGSGGCLAVPVIMGDGEHDDTAGLNALLAGLPVENRSGVRMVDGCLFFPTDTTHRVTAPLQMQGVRLRRVPLS